MVKEPEPLFEPNYKLDTIYVKGYRNIAYQMPTVYGPDGTTKLRMTVLFDKLSSQFAEYDPITNRVVIRSFMLREEHEGQHQALVKVQFGKASFDSTLHIVVSDLKDDQ